MGTKTCTKCGEIKLTAEYYFDKIHQSYRVECKECCKAVKRARYTANTDVIKAANRLHYSLNKEKIKIKQKSYYESNKATIFNYRKQRLKNDPYFKLANSLRNRLNRAIESNWKTGSAVRDLGCSIDELKLNLESKFQLGMTWDNHGKWHIDHIKPLSLFDLTDREQLLEACHYTNLQPMWAEDNLKKNDRV